MNLWWLWVSVQSVHAKPEMVVEDGYSAVLIEPGSFIMNCLKTRKKKECFDRSQPTYKVQLTKAFYMMKTEVTQGLYRRQMGKNPSHFRGCGDMCPVESVSWFDALRFANTLSRSEGLQPCYKITSKPEKKGKVTSWKTAEKAEVSFQGLDCNGWRLPTEAEWAFAARGESRDHYAGSSKVNQVAWYIDNSRFQTHTVCSKLQNSHHLCDMSGNVWEWTWDVYSQIKTQKLVDPVISKGALVRVNRGGSWNSRDVDLRVDVRSRDMPDVVYSTLGFRLCRTKGAGATKSPKAEE